MLSLTEVREASVDLPFSVCPDALLPTCAHVQTLIWDQQEEEQDSSELDSDVGQKNVQNRKRSGIFSNAVFSHGKISAPQI